MSVSLLLQLLPAVRVLRLGEFDRAADPDDADDVQQRRHRRRIREAGGKVGIVRGGLQGESENKNRVGNKLVGYLI